MTYKKEYTISTDTANGAVHLGTLHKEIADLNISGFIGTRPRPGGKFVIEFVVQPSGGDEITLTATVAAHQGLAVIDPYTVNDEGETYTTSTKYVTKCSLILPEDDGGLYTVRWYSECYTSSNKYRTLYRIYNATDDVVIAEAGAPRGVTNGGALAWLPIYGFGTVPGGSVPKTIHFQLRTDSSKRSAVTRRTRLIYDLDVLI